MKKKNVTKSALLASILAMVLCVTMLVGTTFAWFTDTASAKVNKIQSGKLDVVLEMLTKDKEETEATWKDAEGKTLDFVKSPDAPENEAILWEPGCTYNLPDLRIRNNGNLVLKYKIVISGATGDTKLLDAIQFAATVDNTAVEFGNGKTIVTDKELAPNAESTLKISGTMLTSAGNEYQNLTVSGIAITVLATQKDAEFDSTGNIYDQNATYPVLGQNELTDAISGGKKDVTLGTGTYTLYEVDNQKSQDTTLTISGSGADKTTFTVGKDAPSTGEGNADYSFENSDVTFKNMTVSVGSGNYKGFVRAKALYFENCVIEGMGSYWGVGTVVFKNCTFADNAGDYNLWTYSGTDFTFDGCTFNSSTGKFINAYKEQKVDATLKFVNCEFKYTGTGTASKPAVCLKAHTGIIWNTTFTNCTSNAAIDSGTGSTLYSIENGMNAGTTVTIDGIVVWENGAKK